MWDVPTQSDLLTDKSIDPVRASPNAQINATGVTTRPTRAARSRSRWCLRPSTTSATTRLALPLQHRHGTEDGRQARSVDSGWPKSGYQYWKNIEAMGQTPGRRPGDHAHGQATIRYDGRAGDDDRERRRQGRAALAARGRRRSGAGRSRQHVEPVQRFRHSEAEIRERTGFIEYDEWLDFGNVRLLPLWSPGHTRLHVVRVRRGEPGDERATDVRLHGGTAGAPRSSSAQRWQRLGLPTTWPGCSSGTARSTTQRRSTPTSSRSSRSTRRSSPQQRPGEQAQAADDADALTRANSSISSRSDTPWRPTRSPTANRLPEHRDYGPFKPGRENGVQDVRVRLVDDGMVPRLRQAMNVNPRIPLSRRSEHQPRQRVRPGCW